MKIHKIEQRTPEWLELRRGKVTGTGLKKLMGGPKTQDGYFYEVLAERLMVSDGFDQEAPIDRGVRLEAEAREAFEKKTGKIVETVGFIEGDIKNSGCSPDGLIRKGKKYVESVEIKCLVPRNHVRAWLTDTVPEEHMPQIIQAFIVNKDLKTMYSVFYDPRIKVHPLHIIKVERADIEDEITKAEKAEREFLKRIEEQLAKIIKI
jgi:hypothetical protein